MASPPVRPWLLVAGGLLLTTVLVAALLVGGGRPVAPTAGLPDAGLVTGWGQPLVDLLARVLAVLTVGQLTYAALLAPTSPAGSGTGVLRALRGSAASAGGWLLAEGAALVLTASSLYGVPVTGLSVQGVAGLLTGLPLGRAATWVGLLLVAVVLGCVGLAGGPPRGRRTVRRGAPVLLLAALGAVVVPVVLAGHSAAAEDHAAAVVSLSVHVVTASLWVGGLVGLLLHGRRPADVVVAARRFSALALGCVVLLTLSGVAAAVLVAGAPAGSWAGEGWVRLLLVKTSLLLVLAGLGWWHRRGTLPALAAGRPRAFVRLGAVEVAVMAATVAVSVALAASPAPSPGAAATAAGGADAVVDVSLGSTGSAGGQDGATPDGGAEPGPPTAPQDAPAEEMSGHDHGDLSVSVLVDADRFHVAAPVRPGQPVTVYNSSDVAATITAVDGSFDVQAPARTFITFPAPAEAGEHPFVSRSGGEDVAGFADVLRVAPVG
ncbi:CopD family protein [Aquipuribacter sp. MA13-13]